MSGGQRAEMGSLRPLRQALPHLGLDDEDLLLVGSIRPSKLTTSSLQATSYSPDFTSLVQRLLHLRRPGGTLSVVLCGPPQAVASRALAATQLAIGFTQHGLGTVIVDGDFSNPGLSGLLPDPLQEGLVDMVRFGRSCRALLHRPVTPGPLVMGTGSFPVQGREPFEAEAWRGIVHRVALNGDLAIYVGPVRSEEGENPLLRAVDQVVYVAGKDGATEEDLERLRHSAVRVAAVVAFQDSTVPAPEVPAHEPEPEIAAEATEGTSATISSEAQDALAPDAAAVSPASWSPEVGSETPASAAPAGHAARGEEFEFVSPLRTEDAARPPEEEAELRRKLGLDEAEFSYSSGPRYSRVPLYLFLVLMATISGFVGWTLWKSHTGSGRGGSLRPPTTQGADSPEPVTASPEPAAETERAQGGPIGGEPNDAAPQDASPGGQALEAGQEGSSQPNDQNEVVTTPSQGSPPQGTSELPQSGDVASQGVEASTPEQSNDEAPGAITVPSPPGPVYAVHVASYRRMEQANREIANLRKHGYEGRAVRTDLGSKGIWFRVLVGSYPSKEAAEKAREVILKLPEYEFAQVRRVSEP